MLIWLWTGCCRLLLERWWVRGREKFDVTLVKLRYSLTTTETNVRIQNANDLIKKKIEQHERIRMQNTIYISISLLKINETNAYRKKQKQICKTPLCFSGRHTINNLTSALRANVSNIGMGPKSISTGFTENHENR
jgi:hypothetical protein